MEEESAGFVYESEQVKKVYREGLITKSEYLLNLIILCIRELSLETQELYREKIILERIRKEMSD